MLDYLKTNLLLIALIVIVVYQQYLISDVANSIEWLDWEIERGFEGIEAIGTGIEDMGSYEREVISNRNISIEVIVESIQDRLIAIESGLMYEQYTTRCVP